MDEQTSFPGADTTTVEPDPDTYDAMRVPHESTGALGVALHAFFDEMRALRKKHRIAEVSVIVQGRAKVDGRPSEFMSSMHVGDSLTALPMAAWHFGAEQERAQQAIAGIVSRACEIVKRRRGT